MDMKARSVCAVLLCLALAGTSCGKKNKVAGQAETRQEQTAAAAVMEVDDLLAGAEGLAGKAVEVEGVCTHICQHGARKIFLMGSDDTQTIRCEAGEDVGAFKQDCVNSIVRVRGTLMEQRIDEAYLQAWEERAKQQAPAAHSHAGAACEADRKANGEAPANSTGERIANFRKRIAQRQEQEGKAYLSFYYIDTASYTIVNE